MTDTSDSEEYSTGDALVPRRNESQTIPTGQTTNYAVMTPAMIQGMLKMDKDRKRTRMEVAECLSVRKKDFDRRGANRAGESVSDSVRGDYETGGDASSDIGSFVVRFERSTQATAAAESMHALRVAHNQHHLELEEDVDREEMAVRDLGELVSRSLDELVLTSKQVMDACGVEPPDVLVQRVIEEIEAHDDWAKAVNQEGTHMDEGTLIMTTDVPDYGTPSDLAYINRSLGPYDPNGSFELPCARGSECIRSGTHVPGVPQSARSETSVPYKAWIPPDVYRKWAAQGIEPEPEWTCFFCHTQEVACTLAKFERRGVTPPFPLNRHVVCVDETGGMGFPPQLLYQVSRSSTHNGIYGAFPMASMIQVMPSTQRRGRSGHAARQAWNLVIPDFQSTSGASRRA